MYGVGAPLVQGLGDVPDLEFVQDTPAALIDSLRDGKLDGALASSIEAFRRPGYRVVHRLGISSRGPARSVRAFKRTGRGPIRTVGFDNGSATSTTLLRIFLHKGLLGATADDIEFRTVTPTTRPDEFPDDLILLIGDCGLAADPGDREVFDLGQLWHGWTGLPFVYAVWLLAATADTDRILPILNRARKAAVDAGIDDGTAGAIHYHMGDAELDGLRRFHAEAAALDLADPTIEPEILTNDPVDDWTNP